MSNWRFRIAFLIGMYAAGALTKSRPDKPRAQERLAFEPERKPPPGLPLTCDRKRPLDALAQFSGYTAPGPAKRDWTKPSAYVVYLR